MNNIIDSLNWRYATKKFDETKIISGDHLETIKEALRLTPSSFGLQPWKFVILKNKEIQKSLVEHSWHQNQVAEASHVIVLCRKNTLDETFVQEYINDYAQTMWAPVEALDGYKDMMNWFLSKLDDEAKATWANKQIYIALWSIMTVVAEMWIDACPMEWFSAPEYDRILNLQSEDLSSVVVLPIGYRAEDDEQLKRPKVRFEQKDVIIDM